MNMILLMLGGLCLGRAVSKMEDGDNYEAGWFVFVGILDLIIGLFVK